MHVFSQPAALSQNNVQQLAAGTIYLAVHLKKTSRYAFCQKFKFPRCGSNSCFMSLPWIPALFLLSHDSLPSCLSFWDSWNRLQQTGLDLEFLSCDSPKSGGFDGEFQFLWNCFVKRWTPCWTPRCQHTCQVPYTVQLEALLLSCGSQSEIGAL